MQRGQVVRYGVLGLPLAFGALPIYIFVPDLYARSGLLGLSVIGLVLLLTRLLDAVADPLFGWLSDRFPRRLFFYLALVPFLLGFFALFMPSGVAESVPVVWLSLSLALCTLGFSAAMIAFQSWGGDLGWDSKERLQLTGSREAFILIGVVIAAVIPSALSDDLTVGMQQLPWFLLAFLALSLAFAYGLPEGSRPRVTESLWTQIRTIVKDSIFTRLLLVFFINGVASAFPATLFVFFVADVLGVPEMSGLLLGTYFIAAAISVPFWVRLAQAIGRPRTWMCSMVLAMLSFAGAAFLGAGDWLPFLIVCIATGVAVGTDLTIPASLVADLGEDRGGVGAYFGLWNLVAKFNLALGAGIALPVLGYLGYVPGGTDHLDVLVGAYVLLPLTLKAAALLLLARWQQILAFRSQVSSSH